MDGRKEGRGEHLTGQLGSPSDRVLTKYNSPTPKRRTHFNLPDNNGFAKEHRLLGSVSDVNEGGGDGNSCRGEPGPLNYNDWKLLANRLAR
ncbi:unnamed protein product [Leuciscus chuanchicus]